MSTAGGATAKLGEGSSVELFPSKNTPSLINRSQGGGQKEEEDGKKEKNISNVDVST